MILRYFDDGDDDDDDDRMDKDEQFTAVLSSSPNEAYLRLSPPHDKLF